MIYDQASANQEEEQREPELSLLPYKPSTPPPVLQKRFLHFTWKKSVLFLPVLLVIVSVVLFSTSYFPNLNSQRHTNPTVTTQTLITRTALDTVSPSTSPTATPTPWMPSRLLCNDGVAPKPLVEIT